VRFGDGQILNVSGHGAAIEVADGTLYMAIGVRNGGTGLAVIHGWRAEVRERTRNEQPDLSTFRRNARDLYIPAGDSGFWQGAIRDGNDPDLERLSGAAARGERVLVDLLYGDHEGGQRTITRFGVAPWPDVEGERAEVLRYWSVDREDPR
jgi:hypothetical protein